MYCNKDEEDLKKEIFQLKKELLSVNAENHLLKVKVRKLSADVTKKDKEIDALLDPRKYSQVRQIVHERNAAFLMSVKEDNDELRSLLYEKEMFIKKLQNQLNIVKLYASNYSQSQKYPPECSGGKSIRCNHQIDFRVPHYFCGGKKKTCAREQEGDVPWTSGLQEPTSTMLEEVETEEKNKEFSTDIKDQYRSLPKEHLLSIIENLKSNKNYPSSTQTTSRKSSPESDLERSELWGSPHEEVRQLHLYFLEMISEVDHLKYTLSLLEDKQQRTEDVLKNKNNNVDKLVKEIKHFKKSKTRPHSNKFIRPSQSAPCVTSSRETMAQIYSCKNNKNVNNKFNDYNNKSYKKYERKQFATKKDATTQMKESASCSCVYLEKEDFQESVEKGNKSQDKNEDFEKREFELEKSTSAI